MKIPAVARLLINLIGYESAMKMMSASAYGGRTYYIPSLRTGRAEATFAALAECIGTENAGVLCKHFGGERTYIPRMDTAEEQRREQRNREIVEAYSDGETVWDLAGKHRLSDRQIKTILKETDVTAPMPQDIQAALF